MKRQADKKRGKAEEYQEGDLVLYNDKVVETTTLSHSML